MIFLTVQYPHFHSYKQLGGLVLSLAILLRSLVNSALPGLGVMKEKQPGWARFCSGEAYFDVYANQCPAGFFWKPGVKVTPTNWDCVCARGPWRRSNKWCSSEDSQRFVQGDVSCFEPEKGTNMEGMLYLGDQYSAWDSGTPILLTSFTSGITIRQEDFNRKWKLPTRKNDDPGILISRPRDDWTVEDQNNPKVRLCLRAPPPTFDDTTDGIYIYNVSTLLEGGSPDFKLAFTRTCFSWDKDDGKTWYEIIGESIDDKNLIVPKYENLTASDACRRCMRDPIADAPKVDVYGIPLKEAEMRTMDDLKHVGVLTSEINLQTERLGLYWANRLLRDESDYVKENLQEVEILTKAAIMAYGTCDLNHIPKPFYQYFLLLFRRLLSESFKKYAPASPINPEYYSKIEELLNKCMERTKKIEFVLDKSCPPLYKQYKSDEGVKVIPKARTDYNARPAKHDYLLEFIWRLKSFLHYNCFPEFMEDSILHDLIQNQLESLFTEDVLLRWFNPSKAFKMYEHIFKMHLDLKATMSNFEKCVRAVHEISKYPVWLRRPIDQPHRIHTMSRKKRSADPEPEPEPEPETDDETMSLESEYEDMAIESIRQKREDEPEDEEGKKEETEDGETNKPDEPESGEGDTKLPDDDSNTEGDKYKDGKVRLDIDETGSSDPEESSDASTIDPNAEEEVAEKPETDENNNEDKDDKDGDDENNTEGNDEENPTTEEPPPEETTPSDTEVDTESTPEPEETKDENADNKTDDSDDKDKNTNDDEKEKVVIDEPVEPAPDDQTTEDKEPEKVLTLPDEESGETIYTDSAEARGRNKHDSVWNMFTIPGTKGFLGACIESMSEFTQLENKDFGSCW